MTAWRRSITLASTILLLSFVVQAQSKLQHIEILDARQWDFSKRLPLNGTWSFIEKIVTPEEIKEEDFTSNVFPSLWNDNRASGKGLGCATYVVYVVLPDTLTQMALEIPQMYSSYHVWVDGNLVCSAGTVACEKDNEIPKWIYQKASFTAIGDTVQIVLQLSNFHHHKGGAKNPIYLATQEKIQRHFNWSIGSNVFEAGVLFLEGIFFLIFYTQRNNKIVVLYFALLCITWSIRSIFSNLYPVMLVLPDFSWEWLVKIEYLTLYFTVIWATLFFTALFKEMSNIIFTYFPIVLNLFFIVITLLAPASLYTRWISMYLLVAVVVILYAVVLIVNALISDRDGSWFLMSSIWIGVLLFGYDIAAYQSSFSYNVVWINLGYVSIFMLTTVALLYHLGIFKGRPGENNMMTFKDFYQTREK